MVINSPVQGDVYDVQRRKNEKCWVLQIQSSLIEFCDQTWVIKSLPVLSANWTIKCDQWDIEDVTNCSCNVYRDSQNIGKL